MSSSATTRRARIAAIALAAVMMFTLVGGALVGSSGGTTTPAQPAPTTEGVVDLTDLTEEELAALLAQYDAVPTTESPAPAP